MARVFFNQNSARCSAYKVENKMSFIKTFSGKHFYYDRINKDDIVINDIAVSLSNIGNDSNLLIVFYVQIMPDDLVMQLHRF